MTDLLYDLSTGELLEGGSEHVLPPYGREPWGRAKRTAPRTAHPSPIPPPQNIQLVNNSYEGFTSYLGRKGLQDLCRAYSAKKIVDTITVEQVEERLWNLVGEDWVIETNDLTATVKDIASFVHALWDNGTWYKNVQRNASNAGKKNLRFTTSMLGVLTEGLTRQEQADLLGCSLSTVKRLRKQLRQEMRPEMTLAQMEEEFQKGTL